MNKRLQEMMCWEEGKLAITPTLARIREYFIWKRGAACSECSWMNKNPFSGKWVIELDHIDGDRENSAPTNFRLLCPNCHAMTQTYKSLNRKSDRAYHGPCRIPLEDVEGWG